jgi:hypothetical protein
MGKKKSKKKPKRKQENHPTLFILEGTILFYEEGSMLTLHTQVEREEWEQMVEETVKYKVFIECLKETGMPLLKERWEEEDDYFRIQLNVAVSRMRNIDPLLVASHDQIALTEEYTKQMKSGAIEVSEVVTQVRESRKTAIMEELDNNDDVTKVSDL